MNVLAAIRETVEYANACPDVPEGGAAGSGHMEDMLRRIEAADPPFSYGKLCRWLGWMQGCVVAAMDRPDQEHGLEVMKAINKRHADAATPPAGDTAPMEGG